EWEDDVVEALFIDEFNRAHKKIKNAVMELIQFKSINGRKYKNLRIVWAAINPEDSMFGSNEYDIEPLDPAQKDRFHFHVAVPYQVDLDYFTKRFGQKKAEVAKQWWSAMPKEAQQETSPRRLDYALEIYNEKGGDDLLQYVLPFGTNLDKLKKELNMVPVTDELARLFEETDVDKITDWFENENNYANAIVIVLAPENKEYMQKFLPCFTNEKIAQLISTRKECSSFYEKLAKKDARIKQIFDDILEAKKRAGKTAGKVSKNRELVEKLISVDKFLKDYATHVVYPDEENGDETTGKDNVTTQQSSVTVKF
ncbi:MAG: hypothetical protein ACREQ5_36715, partial [Candidatus Dormibacteria bacterium]